MRSSECLVVVFIDLLHIEFGVDCCRAPVSEHGDPLSSRLGRIFVIHNEEELSCNEEHEEGLEQCDALIQTNKDVMVSSKEHTDPSLLRLHEAHEVLSLIRLTRLKRLLVAVEGYIDEERKGKDEEEVNSHSGSDSDPPVLDLILLAKVRVYNQLEGLEGEEPRIDWNVVPDSVSNKEV